MVEIPVELIAAKQSVELLLLALPGVVGIGIGLLEEDGVIQEDELAITILVADMSTVPDGLPEEIGGVRVAVVERNIEPCGFPEPPTRYGDLRGGVQITNPSSGFGTLGCLVEDVDSGDILGLSCFHVVGGPPQTFPDTVWQPANPPLVAGMLIPRDDNLGGVVRADFPQTPPLPFSPIRVGLTDAAVVSLDDARSAGRTLSRGIAGLGPALPNMVDAVTNTGVAQPTDRIRKRGFVTGPTAGVVLLRSLTVNWPSGGPNTFLMEQVEILADDIFCQPGDSGSLVLRADEPSAVGLLWGQSIVSPFVPAGRFAYMSEIGNVESQLSVSTVFA